jgi:metal-responsive CopG/Arc/MetJ family transcriptional regulator
MCLELRRSRDRAQESKAERGNHSSLFYSFAKKMTKERHENIQITKLKAISVGGMNFWKKNACFGDFIVTGDGNKIKNLLK